MDIVLDGAFHHLQGIVGRSRMEPSILTFLKTESPTLPVERRGGIQHPSKYTGQK